MTIEGALTFPKPPRRHPRHHRHRRGAGAEADAGQGRGEGGLARPLRMAGRRDAALRSQTADLPFNQILDADGLSEDCRCLCVLEPVGFAAAEGETTEDGSASTTLTATAMLRLSGWRPYQLQCVADAFSTRFETTLTPPRLRHRVAALRAGRDDGAARLRPSARRRSAYFSLLRVLRAGEPDAAGGERRPDGPGRGIGLCGKHPRGDGVLRKGAGLRPASLPADLPPDTDAYPECWLSVQDLQCASAGGALDVSLTVRAEGAVLARQTASLVGAVELGDPLAPPTRRCRSASATPSRGRSCSPSPGATTSRPARCWPPTTLPDGTARPDEARRLLVPGGVEVRLMTKI